MKNALTVILTVFALIAPPLLWVFGGRAYVRRKRAAIEKRGPSVQARFWYGRMLGLLRAEGFEKKKYETMCEFVIRVQRDLPSSAIDLMPAIALLEKTRYNGENITELDAFLAAHTQLSRGLGAGWGRFKRWWETNATWRLLW